MSKLYIKDGGIWQQPKQIHINNAGTMRNCKEVWVKRLGVWRMIFRRALQLNISANTTDFDLFTAAGSPSASVDIVLTIDLGVVVGSSGTGQAAIFCSSPFPGGSSLLVINKGVIAGAGGQGAGLVEGEWSYAGFPGGPALSLGMDTIINNNSGNVFGGGGGGASHFLSLIPEPGGGGAGVLAGVNGLRFDGSSWSSYYMENATAGVGGGYTDNYMSDFNSSAGGGPGGPGRNGCSINPDYLPLMVGGAAGRAVDRNGYSLSFTSGENASQIKGAYD